MINLMRIAVIAVFCALAITSFGYGGPSSDECPPRHWTNNDQPIKCLP
jgi:hypothetical protein